MTSMIEQQLFSKKIPGIGTISIRPIQLKKDITTVFKWITQPYAKYWGMLEFTQDELYEAYNTIEKNPYHHTYIGMLNDEPIFLMERYKVTEDGLASHYPAQLNDYGMHILVAPAQKRIPQFTWHVFSTVMEYFFSLPYVNRVVVEPDVNNSKIHVLNKRAGFIYEKEIQLPHKIAALAICTKENYQKALQNKHETNI